MTKIKIGRRYTCDFWENDFYTVPEIIEDGVIYTATYDENREEFQDVALLSQEMGLAEFTEGNNIGFYLKDKVVKNTALARKMYPDAEIDGEWLVIYE